MKTSARGEQHLLTLEALFITEKKPKINTKDEYRSRTLTIRIYWSSCCQFYWSQNIPELFSSLFWKLVYTNHTISYIFRLENDIDYRKYSPQNNPLFLLSFPIIIPAKIFKFRISIIGYNWELNSLCIAPVCLNKPRKQ